MVRYRAKSIGAGSPHSSAAEPASTHLWTPPYTVDPGDHEVGGATRRWSAARRHRNFMIAADRPSVGLWRTLRGGQEGVADLAGGQRGGELAGEHCLLQVGRQRADAGVVAQRGLQTVAHQLPGPAHLLGPAALLELPRGLRAVLVLHQLRP